MIFPWAFLIRMLLATHRIGQSLLTPLEPSPNHPPLLCLASGFVSLVSAPLVADALIQSNRPKNSLLV
jgi:hypothetical protein